MRYNPDADYEPLWPHHCYRLGISRATGWRHVARGTIKVVKLGGRVLADVKATSAQLKSPSAADCKGAPR